MSSSATGHGSSRAFEGRSQVATVRGLGQGFSALAIVLIGTSPAVDGAVGLQTAAVYVPGRDLRVLPLGIHALPEVLLLREASTAAILTSNAAGPARPRHSTYPNARSISLTSRSTSRPASSRSA